MPFGFLQFYRLFLACFLLHGVFGIKLRESSVDGIRGNTSKCPLLEGVYISVMRRIYNQGFHKELSTEVELMLTTSVLPDQCTLLIEEIVPRGMYVDPDQMRSLSNKNGNQYYIGVKVDVEKPEFEPESFRLFLFKELKIQENLRVASASFPIHLRYHKPASPMNSAVDPSFEASAKSPSAIVKIHNPRLLLRCELGDESIDFDDSCPERITSSHCDALGNTKCDYLILSYKVNTKNVEVSVPVGNKEHTPYVVGITTFIVNGGTVYLMVSMFRKCEQQ
uniref:Phosphatidylinositol-glycan biosynthesis class X protein n=1 Tax=Caligus clemensi TaxID=344056 RepID=C1C2G3_CALCM|nr:Phosphatidylinositol-glycan biosynthesis class X protein precursor [Caligus clemensi]